MKNDVIFIEKELSSSFNKFNLKYNSFNYILSKNKRLIVESKKKLQLHFLHKYQENIIQEGNC